MELEKTQAESLPDPCSFPYLLGRVRNFEEKKRFAFLSL